jgi:mono/diheme cytochrome c family protein
MHGKARLGRGIALAAIGVAAVGLALSTGPLKAQVHPDAKTGKQIAEKLCVGCHIVGAQAAGAAVPADVPSFARIANIPGQTSQSIAGAIVIPHPPMPQIQLTREEIGDVAAYILTLKTP